MDLLSEIIKDMDSLVIVWRKHVASTQDSGLASDQFSRSSGFNSGLSCCADQLARELDRIKAIIADEVAV
jgi:hypothetical protein